jgi:hypothetical protein
MLKEVYNGRPGEHVTGIAGPKITEMVVRAKGVPRTPGLLEN